MNLWILTEERPKIEVLCVIIKQFLKDFKFCAFMDNLKILPIIEKSQFIFRYEIIGVECKAFEKIFLEIISGKSSFVDYLIFFQKERPKPNEAPLYIIEETKTDDSESRNTGVYQRIAKICLCRSFLSTG